MSEVDYSIDEVLKLLRCFPKAHEAAAADIIDKLRQQLEAAQAERDYQRDLAITCAEELIKAGNIIEKAQKQKHIGVIDHSDDDVTGGEYFVDFAPDTDLVLGGKVYALPPIPAEHSEPNNPALAAIKYALDNINEDPINFLLSWNEGDFDCLRRDWDGVPDEVFIGADPLFKSEVKPS